MLIVRKYRRYSYKAKVQLEIFHQWAMEPVTPKKITQGIGVSLLAGCAVGIATVLLFPGKSSTDIGRQSEPVQIIQPSQETPGRYHEI